MRRFLFTILVLLVLAGVGFGFGYVPIRIEPGTRAVLFSKTSGWEAEPFEPGEFAWRWELLVPTNATLWSFDSTPRAVDVSSQMMLPSAAVYADFLEGEPDLEQELEASIRYRISTGGLAELVPEGLRPDTVAAWYGEMDAQVESTALRVVERRFESIAEGSQPTFVPADIAETIAEEVQSQIPEIEVTSAVVTEVTYPDIELYRRARSAYFSVQDARESALREAAQNLAETRAAADQRISNLERYGRVLSEHPVLLDYLQIAAQSGSDPLDIADIEEFAGAADGPQ